MCHRRPFRLITICRFKQRLPDVKVRAFNDTICMRIITANLNVVDTVLFRQVSQHINEGRAVIGYNFAEAAPPTQDVLVDPIPNSACRFGLQGLKFGIVYQRAAGLDDILETV